MHLRILQDNTFLADVLAFGNGAVSYLMTSGTNHHEFICGCHCFYIYHIISTNYWDIGKKYIPDRFMYANYQGTASYSYVGGANAHGEVDGYSALECTLGIDFIAYDIGSPNSFQANDSGSPSKIA